MESMTLTFKIWRQDGPNGKGSLHEYKMDDLNEHMSLLEALDVLNQRLVAEGQKVIAFDHDCREGICGQCSMYINGRPHGPHNNRTTCQIHLRSFKDGDTVVLEPWRAKSFPVIKDLTVNRHAFDKIIQAGGYIKANIGTAPEAASIPISKKVADKAFDMAHCIGCGACVATCKNSSAALFTAAKVVHLNILPQGQNEWIERTISMVEEMDAQGFGHCSFTGACEMECPQKITVEAIAEMNAWYAKAKLLQK